MHTNSAIITSGVRLFPLRYSKASHIRFRFNIQDALDYRVDERVVEQ